MADSNRSCNVLVLLIGVSKYSGDISDLPGVAKDIKNYENLWLITVYTDRRTPIYTHIYAHTQIRRKQDFYYDVFPSKKDTDWYEKKAWTEEDIIDFLEESRDLLFDGKKLKYDGMILVYCGHGGENCVYSTKGEEIKVSVLHSKFSGAWKGKVTTIPRVFIMDCCRGSQQGGSVKRAMGHSADMISTIYGNSPGIAVSENEKGGYFTQCVIDILKKHKNDKNFDLTDLCIAVNTKLQELSKSDQLCWKEGDARIDKRVFNANGPDGDVEVLSKGNMKEEEREFILNELNYLSSNGMMKTAKIRDHLKDKGVKVVITTDTSTWAYSKHGNMSWSTFKSAEYGKYTIILLSFMPPKPKEITCFKEGNMSKANRDFIQRELEVCSKNNTMTCSKIRDHFKKEGFKAMVTTDVSNWAYSNFGDMSWSMWQSNKAVQQYSIILFNYLPKKDEEISIVSEGSMKEDQRKFLKKELEYCSKNDKMTTSKIRDHLKSKGFKAFVSKDTSTWAYSIVGPMVWSTWQSNKIGKFLIVLLEFYDKESNEITCIDEGSMTADDRQVVKEALRYCHDKKTMTNKQISLRLKEVGKKSIVVKTKGDGFHTHYGDTGVDIEWSEWKDSAYGRYYVMFIVTKGG